MYIHFNHFFPKERKFINLKFYCKSFIMPKVKIVLKKNKQNFEYLKKGGPVGLQVGQVKVGSLY